MLIWLKNQGKVRYRTFQLRSEGCRIQFSAKGVSKQYAFCSELERARNASKSENRRLNGEEDPDLVEDWPTGAEESGLQNVRWLSDNSTNVNFTEEEDTTTSPAPLEAMLALTQLSNYLTLKGSLSAVSKPNFASKYALELAICVGKLSPRSKQ